MQCHDHYTRYDRHDIHILTGSRIPVGNNKKPFRLTQNTNLPRGHKNFRLMCLAVSATLNPVRYMIPVPGTRRNGERVSRKCSHWLDQITTTGTAVVTTTTTGTAVVVYIGVCFFLGCIFCCMLQCQIFVRIPEVGMQYAARNHRYPRSSSSGHKYRQI